MRGYSDTFISAKEFYLFQDELPEYFKLYAYIRSKMDYKTKISGLHTHFSNQSLAEAISVSPAQGLHKNKVRISTNIKSNRINFMLKKLEKIGVIKIRKDLGPLVFEHLHPYAPQSIQNMMGVFAADEGRHDGQVIHKQEPSNIKACSDNAKVSVASFSADDGQNLGLPLVINHDKDLSRYEYISTCELSQVHPEEVQIINKNKITHCPHEKIIEMYHEMLPMCPRVIVWNSTRKRYLQARWKEYPDLDYFEQLFAAVQQSKFLTGMATSWDKNRKPFVATLEWLVRPNNFAKVLEGNYT